MPYTEDEDLLHPITSEKLDRVVDHRHVHERKQHFGLGVGERAEAFGEGVGEEDRLQGIWPSHVLSPGTGALLLWRHLLAPNAVLMSAVSSWLKDKDSGSPWSVRYACMVLLGSGVGVAGGGGGREKKTKTS